MKKLQVFENFAAESSIHGVRYIFNSKLNKFIRIYWIFFSILSICGLFFYAHGLYVKWTQYPDFGIKVQWRSMREVPFPAITVCLPIFAKDKLTNLNVVMKSLQKSGSTANFNFSTQEQDFLSAGTQACNPNLARLILRVTQNATATKIVQLLHEISPQISEVFSICWFRKKKVPCENFFTKVLTDFGFCYSFNLLSHENIFNPHISSDFDSFRHTRVSSWSLDKGYSSQSEEVFPIRASKNSPLTFVLAVNRSDLSNLCLRSGKGFRFFIHRSNEIPTIFNDEQFLTFDTERVITFSARLLSTDPNALYYSPYKRLNYSPLERKLTFFKTYTKQHCDLENLSLFVLKVCGCVKFSMPRFNHTPVCNLSRALCYEDAISRWPNDDLMSRGRTAMPYDCFNSANDVHYGIKLDRSSMYEAKERNITRDAVFAEVSFRFNDFVIEEFIFYAGYKLENFFADTGGLIGLFMGCSLLSFVEIFYFCLQFLHRKIKNETKISPKLSNQEIFKLNRDIYTIREPYYRHSKGRLNFN